MQTIAQRMAASGISGTCASKMIVKTAKKAETLQSAKAKVIASLQANADCLRGNNDELQDKQKCFKHIDDTVSVGVKYTVRYLRNVFGENGSFYEVADKAAAAEVCDMLIEELTAGALDEQLREGIAANKNMRKAK
jgi:hypothetical protein